MFSSRKSCCCRWEGAVVFHGSNKSRHVSGNDENLLSYPIPAFPRHRPHGTVTTKIMCLVHLAAALSTLSATSDSLPSWFLLDGFSAFACSFHTPVSHQLQPFFALEEQA